MSDLISRQDAIDSFDGTKVSEEYCTEYDIGYNDGIDFAISKISVLPSAEKTGEWILDGGTPICDQCKKEPCYSVGEGYWFTDYCPNCGARMVGDTE